ncbi:MAG: outer membrane protein assembly factor BamE [Candidatus Omnitrophota bacterium]|nr:outer membrane protein assembly factor BamE [Candidatus Omnitrophota bacterium]
MNFRVLFIVAALFCCGCSDARLMGKEGRLYLGIPFGQSASTMSARKMIPYKFGLVKVGMTKQDVLDKFGEPASMSMSRDNYWIWYYKSVYSGDISLGTVEEIYIWFDDYRVINPP